MKCRCSSQLLERGWVNVYISALPDWTGLQRLSVLAMMGNRSHKPWEVHCDPRPSLWFGSPKSLCWHLPVMTKMTNMTTVRKLELCSCLGFPMTCKKTWYEERRPGKALILDSLVYSLVLHGHPKCLWIDINYKTLESGCPSLFFFCGSEDWTNLTCGKEMLYYWVTSPLPFLNFALGVC